MADVDLPTLKETGLCVDQVVEIEGLLLKVLSEGNSDYVRMENALKLVCQVYLCRASSLFDLLVPFSDTLIKDGFEDIDHDSKLVLVKGMSERFSLLAPILITETEKKSAAQKLSKHDSALIVLIDVAILFGKDVIDDCRVTAEHLHRKKAIVDDHRVFLGIELSLSAFNLVQNEVDGA